MIHYNTIICTFFQACDERVCVPLQVLALLIPARVLVLPTILRWFRPPSWGSDASRIRQRAGPSLHRVFRVREISRAEGYVGRIKVRIEVLRCPQRVAKPSVLVRRRELLALALCVGVGNQTPSLLQQGNSYSQTSVYKCH